MKREKHATNPFFRGLKREKKQKGGSTKKFHRRGLKAVGTNSRRRKTKGGVQKK